MTPGFFWLREQEVDDCPAELEVDCAVESCCAAEIQKAKRTKRQLNGVNLLCQNRSPLPVGRMVQESRMRVYSRDEDLLNQLGLAAGGSGVQRCSPVCVTKIAMKNSALGPH